METSTLFAPALRLRAEHHTPTHQARAIVELMSGERSQYRDATLSVKTDEAPRLYVRRGGKLLALVRLQALKAAYVTENNE